MRDLTELIRTLESNRACLELGITGAGGHDFSVHSRAELLRQFPKNFATRHIESSDKYMEY